MYDVIHLLNTFRPGGAENVALNYSRVLSKLGYNSLFVALPDTQSYEEYIRDNDFDTAYELKKAQLNNCRYIFVHSNKHLLGLLKYKHILLRKKVRIIYVQHLHYNERKFSLLSKLINLIATDFIRITPVTQDLVNKYIRINIVEFTNFYISKYETTLYPQIHNDIRKEFNIRQDQKIVLFASVFRPNKGLDEFLELAESFKENPEYIFMILGDGPEREKVQNYVYSNIRWLGFVNDVEKYLIVSDFFVFTSKHEMMPMALIEAIAVNANIVCFDCNFTNYLVSKTCPDLQAMQKYIKESRTNAYPVKYDLEYAVLKFENEILIGGKTK